MANSASSTRKTKVDGNNNGRHVSEIGPSNSGSSVSDATALRRSARETLSKKMTPSPSSIRKSERLGKRTSLSPVVRRKSERVEKQKMPSPLRRSKRAKNHSALAFSGSLTSKQKKLKKQKSVKQLTFEAKEVSENEEHDVGTSQVKNKRMNARAYRAMIKKKPKIDRDEESNRMDNLSQEGHDNNGGKIDDCLKENHLDCKEVSENGMLRFDNTKESDNLSATEDRGEIEAGIAAEISEKGLDCMPQKESSAMIQSDDEKICLICKCGGQLLFCNGKGCNGYYHLSCLEPPMVDAPLGVWNCHHCVRKKIELGVYSVSEGVESIRGAREVEVHNVDGLTTEKQFFVKYKGLAHVHNRWVSESQLALEAPLLLKKYNQKDQALRWKQEWSLPHRLLQKRALNFAKKLGDHRSGQAVDSSDYHYEWLVKWRGLGYEHASWELDNASFLHLPEGQRLIKDYEDRHQRAKKVSLFSKADKKLDRVNTLSKLSQMPGGVSPGFGNNNLDAVNKLREHWHKGQNAIIIDDHDRIVKVVAFILSLRSDTYRPFLIISTSAAIHVWEDEFSHWAPSVNVVIYNGNKEIRKSIRKLEFYEEGGCLLFQVLVVLPEIIIEDLDVLGGIEWEAIIVDECQCSKISSYLEQIKMLKTDLRILLFSGQLKDSIVEYHNILALLDRQSHNKDNDELISDSSDCIGQLKDRLSSYVAYKCKLDSFRFVEYWVPVKISNVQLEQYCATLLSNSSTLRSLSKSADVVGALRDILVRARKCCNHPYLVDESLQTLLVKDIPPAEFLDVGIKASGKLHVLDSMLMELQKQGLRVLILFQSIGGSGKILGDILDDFMRQRFGPDSYERVDKYVVHSKKQIALKMFNNKDNGRFVFLLETNACFPSIKLSSVDTIIIFDSDWNPLNDIRSLQKLTLDSQLERIKIFRLLSSYTVEERALVLAKQDKPLDSNLQSISRSISHLLLMWGASCLFEELEAFHNGKVDGLSVNSLSGQLYLEKAVHEFSSILKQDGEDDDTRNCSILFKVHQNGVTYLPNFCLPGERKFGSLDLGPYHLFWTKVLEGKNPQWKYSCGSSQRSRKRVQHFVGSGNRSDFDGEDVVKKRAKVINDVDQPSSKCVGEKLSAGNKEGDSGDTVERPRGNDVEYEKVKKLRDEQRSFRLSLKSEIAKLCEVLLLPNKVKKTADEFLEYVMNNHHVNRESMSILQAFQISLCWTAASLVKHKVEHEASLMLAKQHLNFYCKKEEADYIYSMLRCLKKIFLYRSGNLKVTGSPKVSDSELSNRKYSCVGLAPEVELAMKDVTKSIKEIQKKCQKKLRKLLLKHQEDKNKLNTTYEEEKADLEKKYKIESAVVRSCTPNDVMRTEKLTALDNEYNRRIEKLKCQHEIKLKDLEIVQLAARQKFQEREAAWVADVKSWAQDELLNILPSKEHGNGVEYMKISEPDPDNDPKDMCLVSGHVAEGTNFDRIVEAMTGPVTVDSEKDLRVDHSSSMEQISDGAALNVSDRELSSSMCGNPPLPEQLTIDGVSLHKHNEQIPVEVPESREVAGCHNDTEHQTDLVLLDKITTSGEQERVSRSMNNNTLSQETLLLSNLPSMQPSLIPSPANSVNEAPQDLFASSLTSPRMVDKDATVGGMQNSSQPVEPVSRSVDVFDQFNPESVMEPVEQLQQLPSAESLTSNHTVGETQNSLQEVGPVSSPVGSLPADQSVSDSVVEPVEQVQQLPSAESLTSNPTIGETLNSRQQVGLVSSPVGSLPADQAINDSVMEPLERLQRLPTAESPSSNHDVSGEMQNSSLHVDVLPANRSIMEPLESPNPNQDPSNFSLATGIELQSINEDSLSSHVSQASMEVTNQAVVQPASNSELDSHTPVGALRIHSSETRNVSAPSEINNRIVQTATQSVNRMLPPLYSDPLKNELDRIRKESEQTIKIYEDMKLQLKSDCEREIEEIRRKYDIKLQETEIEFQLKKRNLDTSLNLVLMNKIWAEAFRSKCMDLKVSGVSGIQQDASFAQQFIRLSRHQRDVRPPSVASTSSRPPATSVQHFSTAACSQTMVPPLPTTISSQTMVPPLSTTISSQTMVPPLPTTISSQTMVPPLPIINSLTMVPPLPSTTNSQTMGPPLQATYNTSGICSGISVRPPQINSFIPPSGNHQAGSGFRTTPPHLQPYRPSTSTSMPDASLPTLSHAMSSQQAPNTIPVFPDNHQPTLQTYISDRHNRIHFPEVLVGLHALNLSATEPNMDANSQTGVNLPNALLRMANVASLHQPEFDSNSSMQDNSVHQATSADIVCLSDDD